MCDIRQLFFNTAVFGLICVTGLPVADAQEVATQETSIPCLKLNRIDNVDIVDNKNIVFQTGINDYYLNTLPYTCNGLRINDAFSYSTSLNEICDLDVITVLDKVGPGFDGGPSCGLGKFEPISKEQIKDLKEKDRSKS